MKLHAATFCGSCIFLSFITMSAHREPSQWDTMENKEVGVGQLPCVARGHRFVGTTCLSVDSRVLNVLCIIALRFYRANILGLIHYWKNNGLPRYDIQSKCPCIFDLTKERSCFENC